jgi:chorismate mutase-like protein
VKSESHLDDLRRDIDEVDREILQLLARRMQLVLQVGDYKRKHHLAIYDPDRERRMLERLASSSPAPLSAESAKRIFERLIDESRSLEQRHVNEK